MRYALLVALIASLASGCYAAREREGARPALDGGAPLDAIAVFRDATTPDAGSERCETEVVGRWDRMGIACSERVGECVRDCSMGGSDDCVGGCIELEPDCQRCFYQTVISCGNELGCLDRWRDFACCAEGVPPCRDARGVERLACAGPCSSELDEWSACFDGTDPMGCFLQAADICSISF
ncbi:MAG: hypothetical protein M3Y87_22555 [Myxococcota bacterium]|nr:hypothetical protein [Myxococcota bacterium]